MEQEAVAPTPVEDDSPIDLTGGVGGVSGGPTKKPEPFKLSKEEILKHWQAIRPDTPLRMTPLPYNFKGATYDKDGIRITGTHEFVDSVLGRLKDLMFYENPKVKLNLIYRTLYRKDDFTNPSYAAYVQAEMRGSKTGGNPKKPEIKKPKLKLPKLPKVK